MTRTIEAVHAGVLRIALLVLTLCSAQGTLAQLTEVVYEGAGRVGAVNATFGLLPFAVQLGDELRFRVVLDRWAPEVSAGELGIVDDPLQTVFHRTPIRALQLWVNDAPIELGPTSFELLQNILSVRNDSAIVPGAPTRDEFQLIWRHRPTPDTEVEFVAGLVADSQGASVHWLTSTAIPTQFDFAGTNGGGMNFRVSRFVVTNGFQTAEYDEIAVIPTAFYVVGGAGSPGAVPPPGFGALPLVSGGETWLALATTLQVPNAPAPSDGTRVAAGLWFNTPADEALFQLAEQASASTLRVNLRCGIAGAEGPVVWTSNNALFGATTPLRSRDLISTPASAACPVAIRNVASLQAAADARLLYLEVERQGPTVRGQFWPNSLRVTNFFGFSSEAGASDQQVVGARTRPAAWYRTPVSVNFLDIGETPGSIRYDIPNRQRFGNVTLHCAPAGVDGPAVANLLAAQGTLTNNDLMPAAAESGCGIAINNTASVLEALLRGLLYVVLEPIESQSLNLRGQFRAP